ncbi:MAG: hypothetical protein IJM21_04340 [Clostridia bacterium]|nr:hypothetical protein [Clostridia bacterium]
MRRSLIAVLALALMLVSVFASCTGKTPDVIAQEEAALKSLDNITWKLEVEGAEKTEYTREEAEKHALSHIIVSMYLQYETGPDGNGIAGTTKSFRLDGITLKEFLEDVGAPNATKVTYYGKSYDDTDVIFTIEGDLIQNKNVLIGWIMNKEQILPNFSQTYVGVFGASSMADFTNCCSVSKIVIE